jgi:hypothetical protein
MRKEDQNRPSPVDVILKDKEYKKQIASCSTSLQRNSLIQELLFVHWEVEVVDVHAGDDEFFDFVLHAKVRLRDPWSWFRGNEFDGDMSLMAYFRKGSGLSDYMHKLNRGQRVYVEGKVRYFARSFEMNPATMIK